MISILTSQIILNMVMIIQLFMLILFTKNKDLGNPEFQNDLTKVTNEVEYFRSLRIRENQYYLTNLFSIEGILFVFFGRMNNSSHTFVFIMEVLFRIFTVFFHQLGIFVLVREYFVFLQIKSIFYKKKFVS